MSAIILNKNTEKLKNVAIKTDIAMVLLTIGIPIIVLEFDIPLDLSIVPLFIVMYIGCRLLNSNAHKIYLEKNDLNVKEEYENISTNKKDFVKYVIILLFTGVLLFIISELLGNSLENLCLLFNVPELVIGVLLGFITSVPELITFFESQKFHNKLDNEMLGVVEATNNLLTSNIINLFVIQTIGIFVSKI